MTARYLREAGRVARSRLVVAVAVALALGGPVSLLAAPSGHYPPAIATVYYYGNDSYHLIAFVYDSQGHPLSGLTVTYSSPQPLPPGAPTSGVTDAAGIVAAAFPGPYKNATYVVTASNAGGTTSVTTELSNYPNPVAAGTVVAGFGDLVPIRSGTYVATGVLLAFFAGPNGTMPSGYKVRYQFTQFDLMDAAHPAYVPPVLYPIANFTGYDSVSALNVPPPPNRTVGPDITVQIVNAAGGVVADAGFPPADFGVQSIAPPGTIAAELALSELGLAGLVAGLLAGLTVYGSERVNGTLEPYLARRVSPDGLLAARFLGAYTALGLGTVVGLAALDEGLNVQFGAGLPPRLLLVLLGSSLAALSAWVAIPFAIAHLTRSSVRLTTAVVGTLVIFGFLWTPLLVALGPIVGADPGTLLAGTLTFDANVVNAALASSTLVPAGLAGTDAATVVGVVGVLLAWAIGPIAVALYRARTAD